MSDGARIKSARQMLGSLFVDNSKPWLILGKGPSLAKLSEINTSGYNLAALNHVVATQKVGLAHVVDIEVIEELQDAFYENANYLVMPYYPHKNFRAGSKSLEELAPENSVLEKLLSEGRLLAYDLGTAKKKVEEPDPITVRFFSSEALISLLGECGFRKVRTLGIDGGSKYAPQFDHLADRVRLANGVASFDAQFGQFPEIVNKYKLDFGPVDLECPIPIYVGASDTERLSTRVLEFSIRKRSSISINLIPLNTVSRSFSLPTRKECQPRTPFSFHRFLIPEHKSYQGRAIYLDSDMLVLKDIRKLWNSEEDLSEVAEITCPRSSTEQQLKSKFSVMVLNCEKLSWKIEEIMQGLEDGKFSYEELMLSMIVADEVSDTIPPEWNSLDIYERGVTGLIHFTNMNTQPWLVAGHPHGVIWLDHLSEAIEEGFISREEVEAEVEAGNVRPSLLSELGFSTNLDDSGFTPLHLRSLSKDIQGQADTTKPLNVMERLVSFFRGGVD